MKIVAFIVAMVIFVMSVFGLDKAKLDIKKPIIDTKAVLIKHKRIK